MASSSSTIRVVFDGSVEGLRRAASSAQRIISGVNKGLVGLGKPLLALGAGGGAIQLIAGIGAALSQLAPAALILPGALLAAGAAMATFKLAMSGVGDAIKSGDISALSPQAGAAVTAIRGLKGAFDDLKNSVQDKFFAGLAGDVQALGSTYLPVLKAGLGGIATEFNAMAREGAKALLDPRSVSAVNAVLGNTSLTLGNMRGALGNVLSGFVELGGLGSNFLPNLGTAIDNVSLKFKNWVQTGIDNGSIQRMIDGAIAGFKDLGAIAGNVGSILGSVFSGLSAGTGASSPLAALRDTTAALREFFASAAAQGPLQALGQTMAVVAGVVRDVLLAALRALGPIVQAIAPFVQALAQALGTALTGALAALGPPIASLLAALGGALAPILPVLARLITGLAQAIAPVVAALGPLVDKLGAALLPVIETLVPIITEIANAIGSFLAEAINLLAPLLPPLVAAFGQIVAAVLPLIPPILEIAQTLLPILAGVIESVVIPAIQLIAGIISNVLVPVIKGIIPIVQAVADFLRMIWDVIKVVIDAAVGAIRNTLNWFGQLPGLISGWFGAAKDWAVRKFTELVDWIGQLPQKILGALGDLGNLLVNVGRDIVNGLWNGISAGWNWLVDKVKNLAGSLLDAAKGALGIASPSKLFRDEIGKFIPEGMALGITSNLAPVTIASARMAAAASAGARPGQWTGSSASGPGPAPSASPQAFDVHVYLGDQELKDMVRVEVNESNRALKRGALSGAGRGFS